MLKTIEEIDALTGDSHINNDDMMSHAIHSTRARFEITDVFKALQAAIDDFSAKCWSQIIEANRTAKQRGFTYVGESGVSFDTFAMAGRIMVTFRSSDADGQVTILGSDGPDANPGMHGIDWSLNEAIACIRHATLSFKPEQYTEDQHVTLDVMTAIAEVQ